MRCTICLLKLKRQWHKFNAPPPCKHHKQIHVKCLKQWLKTKQRRTCPTCRGDLSMYRLNVPNNLGTLSINITGPPALQIPGITREDMGRPPQWLTDFVDSESEPEIDDPIDRSEPCEICGLRYCYDDHDSDSDESSIAAHQERVAESIFGTGEDMSVEIPCLICDNNCDSVHIPIYAAAIEVPTDVVRIEKTRLVNLFSGYIIFDGGNVIMASFPESVNYSWIMEQLKTFYPGLVFTAAPSRGLNPRKLLIDFDHHANCLKIRFSIY